MKESVKVVVLTNNIVSNIILKNTEDVTEQDIIATGGVDIGWVYDGALHPPPQPSGSEALLKELDILSIAYEKDMTDFQRTLGSIILSGGPAEDAKIAAIRAKWAARKSKYAADVAAARSKY